MKWAQLGITLLPVLLEAVTTVERLIGGGRGDDKKALALDLTGQTIRLIEGATSRDVLDDPAVVDCVSRVIDAVVAAQRVIATVAAQKEEA